ncbi:hypothetical protein C3432_19275 [Citrobacter amalonaticus]|uniref:Putative Se/S carrier protein-like domain-containing protein n=1 Tax=Citrobacter amalonaticus TaxID=35703 RepID=A0A2S4RXH4_CITAM|nr:DUF3343 domain-containing protein [Citrobacter amalonaticus]POT56118.1 hypothetical protein C3432_19275 [Citrobacter amalonaticus]POT74427.1 hypothetical protein C3436_16915 [Citrobacter amalonaticus]POU65226.1 hypothetical protein C3430_13655 [Citrobacter amalonaticus]POV04061.1 hypothetical protein C3424_18595 [Citrobacter amalonaticus]
MTEFLFLFHSTVGVIQTRKALQAEGMAFRVADIPRQLRGGCGLCIYLTCPAGKEKQWVIAGHTESIYRLENGDWRCVASFSAP